MNGRFAVAIANIAALALLAVVLAYWGWRWFAPTPAVVLPAEIPDVNAALAVSPPFGASPPVANDPAPGPAPIAGDVRLLGVIAERDGRGRALLRMADGTARLAAAGESLGAAGTIAKVGPDGITLRDGRGERRLELHAAPVARPGTGAAVRSASCVPTGYRGAVVRLNAELVSGWIAQPQSLHAIAQPTQDGLVVRDDSGLAAMLGLRKGDRVMQANGIPLRAPEDVVIAVLRPLAANQGVRISGVRGNAPHELMIVNAATCP